MPLFFQACQSPKAKEEELAKEVLALHDEVMPKMQDIMRLKKELKKKLNQVDSSSNEALLINDLISGLEKADKDMMDWMHTYNGGQDLYTHEEVMAYLNAEKSKMQVIKEETWAAIEEGKLYLEE